MQVTTALFLLSCLIFPRWSSHQKGDYSLSSFPPSTGRGGLWHIVFSVYASNAVVQSWLWATACLIFSVTNSSKLDLGPCRPWMPRASPSPEVEMLNQGAVMIFTGICGALVVMAVAYYAYWSVVLSEGPCKRGL
ncbi:hypothetical protein QQF64_000725 [Cirrhinus molitorella]|uniref:Uncharacterized protein n=1 Tax=Cirrhinus molitorella TaxID=172907 RepID=A0ABR3NYM7_9TELE